jgi:hypothetical protein
MAAKTKTWQQKMQNGKKPEVKRLDKSFADLKEGSDMLISTPVEIAQHLRRIPKGKTKTVLQLRQELAKKHKADGTCPLTTGIFLRIASEAALEQIGAGAAPDDVTPFWRVVEPGSKLAKKLSCGDDFIESMRAAEIAS